MIAESKIFTFTHNAYGEDRFILPQVCDGYILLGIADGHNGTVAAEHCSRHVINGFLESSQADPGERMCEALQTILEDLAEEVSGTTLSLCCVDMESSQMWGAFIGDSPIVQYQKDNSYSSPIPHNVRCNSRELERILLQGGRVEGGYLRDDANRGLQLSRSIGDASFGGPILRDPEVFTNNTIDCRAIVVASDGFITNSDDIESLGEVLVEGKASVSDWSQKRKYDDDASVVILYI